MMYAIAEPLLCLLSFTTSRDVADRRIRQVGRVALPVLPQGARPRLLPLSDVRFNHAVADLV